MFITEKIIKVQLITLYRNEMSLVKRIADNIDFHLDEYNIKKNKKSLNIEKQEKKIIELESRIKDVMTILDLKEKVIKLKNISIDPSKIEGYINNIIANYRLYSIKNEMEELEKENERIIEHLKVLDELKDLDLDIKQWNSLKYLYMKIGYIAIDSYDNLIENLRNDEIIVSKLVELPDKNAYIIVVLSDMENKDYINNMLKGAFFSEISFPPEYAGSPKELTKKLNAYLNENKERINLLKKRILEIRHKEKDNIIFYSNVLRSNKAFMNMKKKFSYTDETTLITGYIRFKDWSKLLNLIDNLKFPVIVNIIKISNKEDLPVLFSNPKIFKPFELLTDTYGHPKYNEIDPTPFIAITYPLFFGIMFGDVGQGLILLLLGYILKRFNKKFDIDKKMGEIIMICSMFSIIFGVLYGSFFGFEEIIPAVLFSPMNNFDILLKASIIFGFFYILIGIGISLINKIKNRNLIDFLFDKSGLIGFLLYLSLIFLSVLVEMNFKFKFFLYFVFLPIIVVFMFKDFIIKLIFKRKLDLGLLGPMHIFEGFLELFDVLIGFLGNTVSFLRLGAFALSHGALMGVIVSLYEAIEFMPLKIGVIIFGNILVILLEGLVVGIQAIRLEYYEFLSRFYNGNGKMFNSIKL